MTRSVGISQVEQHNLTQGTTYTMFGKQLFEPNKYFGLIPTQMLQLILSYLSGFIVTHLWGGLKSRIFFLPVG